MARPVGRFVGITIGCEGLTGPAEERCVLGMPLREWCRASFRTAGLEESGPLEAEAVVAEPGVAFSARAVAQVLATGRARRQDVRGIPDSRGAEPVVAVTGRNPGLVYLVPGGSPDIEARVAAAAVVLVDAEERSFDAPGFPGGPLRVADAWVLPVAHWTQLLWANLLALGPFLWGALVGTGVTAASRLAWAAVTTGSTRPENLAAVLTRRGRGARVHRTAVVEGSILGEGASVGAGSVVRGCVLGPGAVVEELAIVEGVVMGAGARIQRMALAKFGVIEEHAAHAGILQLAVVGRGAQVKHGATLMDMALGQSVSVRVGGGLRAAPHGICGVCVGDGAVVGSGVRVAPGRAIPPNLTVMVDPWSVLRIVEAPVGCTRAVVRDGALEPIE